MAIKKAYFCTALTGGGDGALDSIDGATLNNQDAAVVIISSNFYIYFCDADVGGAESSPDVIAPDTNPGTVRWKLTTNYGGLTDNNEAYYKRYSTLMGQS